MSFKWLVLFVFSVLIVLGSCQKEEKHGDNQVTIRILEPTDGETIADDSEVHIHIEIEASEENHEVEIRLHPEGDANDLILDYDEHNHDTKIVFEQDLDLSSYPAGTEFHLEVEACADHDCEEIERANADFSI